MEIDERSFGHDSVYTPGPRELGSVAIIRLAVGLEQGNVVMICRGVRLKHNQIRHVSPALPARDDGRDCALGIESSWGSSASSSVAVESVFV